MLGDATIQTVLEDRFVHENVYLGPICLPYFSAVKAVSSGKFHSLQVAGIAPQLEYRLGLGTMHINYCAGGNLCGWLER